MQSLVSSVKTKIALPSLAVTATKISLGVIAMAVLSQVLIPLPFTPVPLSLGTLGALLLGVFLTPRNAAVATVTYGLLGAAGLPILAGFSSGIMLASFGYVIGYVLAAVTVSVWVHRSGSVGYVSSLLVVLAASALVYVPGVLWMSLVFGVELPAAIALGVTPFLLGDTIKALVVVGIVRVVRARSKSW